MRARDERGRRRSVAAADGTDPSTVTDTVHVADTERAGESLLVGNNIENPGNALALAAAADMFGWECSFLADDRHPAAALAAAAARTVSARELAESGATIVALENARGAESLWTFQPPKERCVLIVGNERRGIAGDVLRLADRIVEIPNVSAPLNCLNVAAAAAIAVHHLARRRGRGRPLTPRPAVLLAAPTDAIETGSVVRSAACLGWSHVFIDDRHRIWFETDRVTRSLGRGAARRGRNPIRVLPAPHRLFDEVCVVGAGDHGEPLAGVDLAPGVDRLVVLPDGEVDDTIGDGRWARLGRSVRHLRLDLRPGARAPFRLVGSIALAALARRCALR